jgi:hypothetical protein
MPKNSCLDRSLRTTGGASAALLGQNLLLLVSRPLARNRGVRLRFPGMAF